MKAIDKVFKYRFLFFWDRRGGGDVHWRPVWCGGDGTPHRLRSSVLAGRDNYTPVWNKVCTEAAPTLHTVSSHLASQVPKETKNNDRPLSCRETAQNHYNYLMHVFIWMTVWKHKVNTEINSDVWWWYDNFLWTLCVSLTWDYAINTLFLYSSRICWCSPIVPCLKESACGGTIWLLCLYYKVSYCNT